MNMFLIKIYRSIDIVPELLSASYFLRKDTTWQITFEDDCVTFVSPVFDSCISGLIDIKGNCSLILPG